MIRALKAIAPTLLAVACTIAVCLGLLEAGLRAMGRLPSNVTDGIFEQRGGGYRLRRNMTKVSRTPSFVCTIHTNALGLRDRTPGPRQLGPRPFVAWVGDSITFGNGVEYDETFVGVFGEAAARRGLDVVNLAIGGHRFGDQEETLFEFLEAAPQPPAQVVLVMTAQGLTTFEQPYTDIFVKDGYIFPKERWLGPYVTIVLGNSSSAYSFVRDGLRRLQARLFPAGPTVAREAIGLFSRASPWAGTEVPARLEARLARLDQRIREKGATPVYVYMPTSLDLRAKDFLAVTGQRADQYDFALFSDLLRHHAEQAGVRFIDLSPILQAAHDRGERLSFSQDSHYTASANRTIGLALVQALLGEPAPGAPPGPPAEGRGATP